MAARWSADSVLALAPDPSAQRAAASLAGAAPWRDWGTSGGLVWGLCAGSGKDPYQVAVDLTGPAYRCSCPSRKFPCKHALGLLLNWAGGRVPERAEVAGFAGTWQAGRTARAEQVVQPARAVKDPAAAARRSQQRAERVAAGLAELQMWLCDQIRAGLSGAAGRRHAERIAARMVDAQAPGVANVLRRLALLPATGDGWPDRLLAEYAQLHLLARAYGQLADLPPGLAAVVRSRIGFTVNREDVLAAPPVGDHWLVVAVRDVPEPPIPARRIWLLGRDTGRFALLVMFAVQGNFFGVPDAGLSPGTELDADLHYYPGQPPLRAVIGARRAKAVATAPPAAGGDVAALLAGWAKALEQDPWLTEWPVLLTGTPMQAGSPALTRTPALAGTPALTGAPVQAGTPALTRTPVQAGGRWQLADTSGAGLPLAGRESLWRLLSVSGGNPVTIAGEWGPAGLTALTTWHGGRAVPL